MDTVTQYAIRSHGTVSATRFGSEQHARRIAEDIYGVDSDAVQVIRVTTTFEVV